MGRLILDEQQLRSLYLEQGWTMARLAAHFGCAETTVRRSLVRFGISPYPRGPRADHTSEPTWSPDVAYAVGVIATDGNLSKDGRHLSVTSKDKELLETLRKCLWLSNAITLTVNGAGQPYFRLQWGNRRFIEGLHMLGLTPAKSLTLGALAIPDAYFADFLRGCIDGDGSILTYTDHYHTRTNPKYVYERLAICLVSASSTFVEWVRATSRRIFGVTGALIRRPQRDGRATQWLLKYGKRESLILLRAFYYATDVPCLARKRDKAMAFIAQSSLSEPGNCQV